MPRKPRSLVGSFSCLEVKVRGWAWFLQLFMLTTTSSFAQQLLAGGSGWALRFDGQDDLVLLDKKLPSDTYTVDMWVNPFGLKDGAGLDIVTASGTGVLLSQTSMAGLDSPLTIVNNGGEVRMPGGTLTGTSTDEVDPAEAEGMLYHYAFVLTPDNATSYLNGVQSGFTILYEVDQSQSSANYWSPLCLGARFERASGKWDTTDRNFGGILDELRIWDVALSAEEIGDYMGRTVSSTTPGLYAQWKFDDGIGDMVVDEYSLGGGDSVAAPVWVPSPVVGHGGPVAMTARLGETTSQSLCALLTPSLPGAEATVVLERASTLGSLVLSSTTLLETSEGSLDGSTRFCTSVTLVAASSGFENVPFTVSVSSPSGSFTASQNVSISISGNTPPSAGSAKAIQVNGEDQYLSMGSWDPGDEFTISMWLDPVRHIAESMILSIHQADGTNLFYWLYTTTGYTVAAFCYKGCGGFSYGWGSYPAESGSEMVLQSGLTADEVTEKSMVAHHLTLTWNCTRGDASLGTTSSSTVKMYQDGLLIGSRVLYACLNTPLTPDSFGVDDLTRPTPWEVGSEYDPGTLDEHEENVAVEPSNFLHATFDDFTVWKRILTDDEVTSVANNGSNALPHEDDIIVRFTFDLDDEEDCQERQLWNASLTCNKLNEEQDRISPTEIYPWTPAAIYEATPLPSPFYRLRGSPLHRSMAAGTCANITLLGADADGDALTYSLGESPSGVSVALSADQLQFCDGDASRSELSEVEFSFDACDPYGACASSVAGLGSAIFHVLPVGPKILAFQVVIEEVANQNFLRIVFNRATSCPTFVEPTDITQVLQLSNSSIVVQTASWEEGCAALRVHVLQPSLLPSFAETGTTVEFLLTGGLRDADETSYPVVGLSPALELLSCSTSEVLLAGEVACSSCAAGSVPGTDSDGYDVCQPCSAGTAGLDSCTSCTIGAYANETGLTACRTCPVGHSCSKIGLVDAVACSSGSYQELTGQSACTRCEKGSYAEDSASSACTLCRSDLTTEGTGYSTEGDCKCPEGYYRVSTSDLCVECGEGAFCGGFGAEPQAAEGYMLLAVWPDHLDIFSCSETNRCPGGLVGVCAEGREGISCSSCKPGRRPSSDGTCQECSGADSATSIIVIVVVAILLAVVYTRMRSFDSIRARHESVLALTTVAQILLLLQLSSVLARISIQWPEPVLSFMNFLLLFNFDLDILRVGCVKSLSDYDKYIGKLAIIPVAIAILIVCHLASSMLSQQERGDSRMRLLGAIGVFVSALYISLTSYIAAPLQCNEHPNGRWTMVSAEAVLCWEGGDHTVMLVLGFVFLLIPITFFGWMVRLMQEFPLRMSRGDVAFLNSFAFLFMRVRPEARWFMIFVMARNGLVALIPAVPNGFWECGVLILIFAISSGVTLYVWPWKLNAVNYFDIATAYIFQALGCCSLAFVSDYDTRAIPEVVMVLMILCLCLTPLALIHWLLLQFMRKGNKAFRWFLCHHKASAGTFARLLKLSLYEKYGASVFLDSDNLVDLNLLFLYVKQDTQTLTVLVTKEILQSPWCLGEMSVARLSNVNILPLFWHDFDGVQDDYVMNVESHVSLDKVFETGVSIEDVRKALRYLQSPTSSISLKKTLNEATLYDLTKSLKATSKMISSTMGSDHVFSQDLNHPSNSSSAESGTIAVLVDVHSNEAIAGGLILVKLLRPLFSDASRVPFVAGLDSLAMELPFTIPKTVTVAILLCTPGCFESRMFLQLLVATLLSQVKQVLPAAATTNFSFPTPAFYKDLESAVKEMCVAAGLPPDGSLLTAFVKSIFQKIFMNFFVQGSMTILNTQVQIVYDRLGNLPQGDAQLLEDDGRNETLKKLHAFKPEVILVSSDGPCVDKTPSDEDLLLAGI